MTVMDELTDPTRQRAECGLRYLYLFRAMNDACQRQEQHGLGAEFAGNEHRCSSACRATITT